MANTLTDTINYIKPFCRYQAANIGTSSMPIIGIGNLVRNIILAAPMTWRFNRKEINLTGPIVKGQQDYVQAIADFGFLEKAIANDGVDSFEFSSVKNNDTLAPATKQGRPMSIAVHNDDGAGNITFRLSPVPDKSYAITLTYQKGPAQSTVITAPWAPIPDAFSDIYNNMSLGYYMDSCQDPRAPQYIGRGIAGLLARATGLSAMDKAVFAASYLSYEAAQALNMLRTQQGQQAQAQR